MWVYLFQFPLYINRHPVLTYVAVNIQPLLSLPHGSQHVCALELLQQYCVYTRERTICGFLPVSRFVFKCVIIMSLDLKVVSTVNHRIVIFVHLSSLGVISTLFSYLCKTATGRLGPSLGAVRLLTILFMYLFVFIFYSQFI